MARQPCDLKSRSTHSCKLLYCGLLRILAIFQPATHRNDASFLDVYLEATSISDRLPLPDASGQRECN